VLIFRHRRLCAAAVAPPIISSAPAALLVAAAACPSAPADSSPSTSAGADAAALVFGPAQPSPAATNPAFTTPSLLARPPTARAALVSVVSVASSSAQANFVPWSAGLGSAQEHPVVTNSDFDMSMVQGFSDESDSDTATSNASTATGSVDRALAAPSTRQGHSSPLVKGKQYSGRRSKTTHQDDRADSCAAY
jgi:hypothetical protein